MKLIGILLFLSTTIFASDCVVDQKKIQQCHEFKKNVLEAAVFEDPKAGDDESIERFVKDEKKATEFLKAYDPAKRAMKDEYCLYEKTRKKHSDLEKVKGPLGCEISFTSLRFFRGLVSGIKINGWGTKTEALGEEVIEKHVKHVLSSQPHLLDTLISFHILKEAQSAGLLKGKFKDVQPFLAEGEKISEDLQAKRKTNPNDLPKEEIERTASLLKKWHQ